MFEISLAIVTYNQSSLLRLFLETYQRLRIPQIKLIIVDDGSVDETPSILSQLTQEAGFHCHRIPHGSIAKARNHALRICPTPWIAFTDTDCRLGKAYLEILQTLPVLYPEDIAIEGAVLGPKGCHPPFTHGLTNSQGGMYVTANMAFKVKAILEIGGFDEQFKNYREDVDLALTILEKYGPIRFLPELVVLHPQIPKRFIKNICSAFSNQSMIVGSEMRLFKKHPSAYAKIRHFPDARSTLKNWCLKYSLRNLRDGSRFVFQTPPLSPQKKLNAIFPFTASMVVSIWEQTCIVLLCMLQWKKISRLVTK